MSVIFCASGDRMSFQHTSNVIAPFLHWLLPHLADQHIHAVVVLVRKMAHLTEYAILTCLIWRLVRSYRDEGDPKHRWIVARITLLAVIIYAASDEFHQLFVPSREASVRDVLIDTSGAILALSAIWFRAFWQQKRLASALREPPSELQGSS
jgi:VanZ family protein